MARDNRIQVPSSHSGIVRYFEDYKSKLEIQPYVVVFACGFIAVLVILLHMMGGFGA